MANSLLVVKRDSLRDIKMRDLLLSVDGQELANLKYGGSFVTEVAPGTHTVSVSNRLFAQTKTFTTTDGEEVDFRAENSMSGPGLFMLEIFGVGPYRAHIARTR